MAVLNAIVGNWAQPGGLQPVAGEERRRAGRASPSRPTRALRRCAWTVCRGNIRWCRSSSASSRRSGTTILTGQPYQAHGWFIYRQNPMLSLPDRGKTLEAFNKLDFIVTIDITMNDTAWFSDVVLPEATYLERYDPLIVGDRSSFASR